MSATSVKRPYGVQPLTLIEALGGFLDAAVKAGAVGLAEDVAALSLGHAFIEVSNSIEQPARQSGVFWGGAGLAAIGAIDLARRIVIRVWSGRGD